MYEISSLYRDEKRGKAAELRRAWAGAPLRVHSLLVNIRRISPSSMRNGHLVIFSGLFFFIFFAEAGIPPGDVIPLKLSTLLSNDAKFASNFYNGRPSLGMPRLARSNSSQHRGGADVRIWIAGLKGTFFLIGKQTALQFSAWMTH